jgi:hypothetical protein
MPAPIHRFDPKAMRPALTLFFAAATAGLLAGCATRYIPNTDVEDTEDNKRIITFCEKYRHAVELKDTDVLTSMASKDYYEDGGNVDASDDLDYEGLLDYLKNKFDAAQAIRYEIRYRRILRQPVPQKENDAEAGEPQLGNKKDSSAPALELIYVDYTYSASYRIPASKGGEEWRRRVDDNRLEILRYADNTYRIVAGM